jgi:MerR family transcriptional regulator, copper efflux regulator
MSNLDRGPLSLTDIAESLTIGQISKLTGISAKVIRYYESIGLLPRPKRDTNYYRRYSRADISRLNLLNRIRLIGVPLSEAKSLLLGSTDARCIEVQQELLKLVGERLIVLDREIAELQQFRTEVESYQSTLSNCNPDEHEPFRTCLDMSCIAISATTNERK